MKPISTFTDHAHRLLTRDYPQLTEKQRTKIINRYIKAVTDEINQKLRGFMLSADRYVVSTQKINQKTKSTINGKQVYMHNWFMNNCPLIQIMNLGSNLKKKYTEVKMNYNLKIMIDAIYAEFVDKTDITDDERAEYSEKLYTPEFFDIIQKGGDIDYTPIDLKSLKSYVEYIKSELQSTRYSEKGKETLNDRLREAKRIHSIAKVFNGQLPQIVSVSEFGRKYYKGPNLQSVSKEVRLAALGNCIEYDIENSVFAWRYTETMNIASAGAQLPYTLQYLEQKANIRAEVAQHTFADSGLIEDYAIKVIKQAFTAISFGAKGQQAGVFWNAQGKKQVLALGTIIYKPEHRKLFLAHPFIKEFIAEQKLISDIIYEYYRNEPEIKNLKCLQTDAGNLSKSKTLAYLYQQQERKLLDAATQHLSPDNILLTVHDAFYIKRADAEGIKDARYELKQYNKELDLGKEEQFRLSDSSYISIIDEIDQHKARMAEQEEAAQNYHNNHTTKTTRIIPMEDILYERSNMQADADMISELEEQAERQERIRSAHKDITELLNKRIHH